LAAGKADAAVSVTIIDPAIISNVRPPITIMEAIVTAGITPITWRPIISYLGRSYPNAGHPIIAVDIVVCPITGLP